MNNFTTYLEKNGYASKSLPIYQRAITRLNIWMNEYGTTKETIDYKTFLNYIEQLKKTPIKVSTLQNYINSLKIFLITYKAKTIGVITHLKTLS
ncbi:hypothetical protein E5F92_000055 [Flavobacterium columnare]|uniref:site-specific integrase n=1 Tax=Flavobacterium columnare TaxID=996 RepID=UPI002989BDC8|nr:site-specific integrase [Flavobacterium columnare]MCH4831149.1 hypothetical protein [Flavobacterium columnare]